MKNSVFLVLLTVMLALSTGLVGCGGGAVPEASELMIYEVNPAAVSAEYVQNLSSTLFQTGVTQVYETPQLIYVPEPYYLECCKSSGSIWFADLSKLYNEEYIPQELPAAEDARAIAEEFLGFLAEQGLIPEEEFEFYAISETQTATFNAATSETETRINHLDVIYIFRLGGAIRLGEKIRVSIGDKGEIIGFHYVCRDLVSFEPYQAITEDEAMEIFKAKLGGEPEEVEVRLEYYFEPEFIKQDFAQPYYVFDGTVMIEEEEVQFKTQLIPATTFSPMIRIESPDNGAEFYEGEMVPFEASVSGGEPPYEYVWESNIDGVLGTGASLSSDLSVCQRDGEVLPHTIKLTVTDQNGSRDTALVPVRAIPTQATSVLAMESAPGGIRTLSNGSPADDMNTKEVAIEWINAYDPFYLCPLSHEDENARGFRDELVADEWVSQFDRGDYLAWEQDFKFRGGPEGGTDFEHIDAVDFAYFSGHGGYDSICFRNLIDYRAFSFENARWGGSEGGDPGEEGDLEWIVLDACSTLKWCKHISMRDLYVFDRWDQAFDGLHYVLGFGSACGSSPNRGTILAQYMKQGWEIRLAWIRATQATEMPWASGAYLRAERLEPATYTYYDHLPGHGFVSADPYPADYLVYCTWTC